MQLDQSIFQLLTRLWQHISPRRRLQFGLLLILMVLAAFAELLSIGMLLPFLGVLTAPDRVFADPAVQPIIQALGFTNVQQLLLPITIAFGFAAMTAGAMRLLLLWANTRLSFATGSELSISIYRRTLYQPYEVHCTRNSSEIINGISSKTSRAIYTITMVLTLVSSGVMLVVVLAALFSLDPYIVLVAFGSLSLAYLIIIRLTRNKLLINGEHIARESTHVIKCLQEGLGGIRDVLINGGQAAYCKTFHDSDLLLRRAEGNNFLISASPRYGMEAIGMLVISMLAYSLVRQPDSLAKAIPTLGVLAMGAQRLLPVLQQAYGAWSQIKGGQSSFQETLELLDQPLPDYVNQSAVRPLSFQKSISLKNLSFCYNKQTSYVLKGVDLDIVKGSRVGFIGTTGSGKSTLLDVIMGLLHPTQGCLLIDGQVITPSNQRAWQSHIAHVPQAIFLADSTIEQNIAFGVQPDQIDMQCVRRAAQQAQIADSIESWPKQYQTLVGEHGIRLSGGQRQRIGLARALYRQADVIILDEATSALDNETEQAVMQSIEGLDKDLTILMIAHRLTTLKKCTQIVELDDGAIKYVGSYKDVAG